MARFRFRFELVAHRLVGEEIIALAGKQPAHCDLIVLIRLDPELTPMMPVRNESLVQLLNRERHREVFRMTMPDVAHEAMKYSI
jgi:hypothetical protein